MNHILYGIFWGTLTLPLARIVYYLVAWYLFGGHVTGDLTAGNLAMIGFSDLLRSMVAAAILLTIYALPVFLIMRWWFGKVSWGAIVLFAIIPWAIFDLYGNRNFNHFIEYSWYSIACGLVFWHHARRMG